MLSLFPLYHNAPLPPSPSLPFAATWLHLMTGLTPAYRIKLISTKQGPVEGGGGDGGVRTTTGGQGGGKVQQEEGTINGPPGGWCWASSSAGCWSRCRWRRCVQEGGGGGDGLFSAEEAGLAKGKGR